MTKIVKPKLEKWNHRNKNEGREQAESITVVMFYTHAIGKKQRDETQENEQSNDFSFDSVSE